MKRLGNVIWNSEPVRFSTALTTAWTAIVAFDVGNDSWEIPLAVYIVMIPVIGFIGELTRSRVSPTGGSADGEG